MTAVVTSKQAAFYTDLLAFEPLSPPHSVIGRGRLLLETSLRNLTAMSAIVFRRNRPPSRLSGCWIGLESPG